MKTLTQIYFKPPGAGALYFTQGSTFAGVRGVEFAELPGELQTEVGGAMAWLSGMAGTMGFVAIEDVYLRRTPDGEDGPAFVAEVTGVNAAGMPGFAAINSVPGPETTAMAGLWELFQGQLNGEEE